MMRNLDSQTKVQHAIGELTKGVIDNAGDLAPMPTILADFPAPSANPS
jgi:hypothetical protein